MFAQIGVQGIFECRSQAMWGLRTGFFALVGVKQQRSVRPPMPAISLCTQQLPAIGTKFGELLLGRHWSANRHAMMNHVGTCYTQGCFVYDFLPHVPSCLSHVSFHLMNGIF